MFAFAMTMRARARTLSTSVFVGLVVTCGATMRKVTGSNPVVCSGTFYPYGTLSRRGDQVTSLIPVNAQKKFFNFFGFSLMSMPGRRPHNEIFLSTKPGASRPRKISGNRQSCQNYSFFGDGPCGAKNSSLGW